jgi:hypothetical protein
MESDSLPDTAYPVREEKFPGSAQEKRPAMRHPWADFC